LHADAIREGPGGIVINFSDTCDDPLLVARTVHIAAGSGKPWRDVQVNSKASLKR
jgi:putative ATP-dependent endonuclease of OLD family